MNARDIPHFSTDEHLEVIDGLELAVEAIGQAWRQPRQWKWVAIGVTMAVQGLMVVVIDNGNDVLVQTEKDIEAFEHWYEHRQGPMPSGKLAGFWDLFDRVFPTKPVATEQLGTIVRMRKRFVHFLPAGHAESVVGLPHCVMGTCELMRQLLSRGRWFDPWQKARVEMLLAVLERNARSLEFEYRPEASPSQ